MQTINRYDVMRAMSAIVEERGKNYVDRMHMMMVTRNGEREPACFVGTLMHHMVEPSFTDAVRQTFGGSGGFFTASASSYGIHFTDDREKSLINQLMVTAQIRNDRNVKWGAILVEMQRIVDAMEKTSPPSRRVVEDERRRKQASKVKATAKRLTLPNMHFLSRTTKK